MTEINDATDQRHHFAFCVQYHGGAFRGWQRQHGQASIQGELERALGIIANEPIALRAAGRTDAGVHGTGQIAAFSTNADRPVDQWLRGVNGLTPATIQVSWFKPVAAEFHPRFDAVARRYTYLFHDRGRSNPFMSDLAWCTDALDENAMHVAAQTLLGEHDFSSFRGAGCQSLTPMRRVDRCEVRREGAWGRRCGARRERSAAPARTPAVGGWRRPWSCSRTAAPHAPHVRRSTAACPTWRRY